MAIRRERKGEGITKVAWLTRVGFAWREGEGNFFLFLFPSNWAAREGVPWQRAVVSVCLCSHHGCRSVTTSLHFVFALVWNTRISPSHCSSRIIIIIIIVFVSLHFQSLPLSFRNSAYLCRILAGSVFSLSCSVSTIFCESLRLVFYYSV